MKGKTIAKMLIVAFFLVAGGLILMLYVSLLNHQEPNQNTYRPAFVKIRFEDNGDLYYQWKRDGGEYTAIDRGIKLDRYFTIDPYSNYYLCKSETVNVMSGRCRDIIHNITSEEILSKKSICMLIDHSGNILPESCLIEINGSFIRHGY